MVPLGRQSNQSSTRNQISDINYEQWGLGATPYLSDGLFFPLPSIMVSRNNLRTAESPPSWQKHNRSSAPPDNKQRDKSPRQRSICVTCEGSHVSVWDVGVWTASNCRLSSLMDRTILGLLLHCMADTAAPGHESSFSLHRAHHYIV